MDERELLIVIRTMAEKISMLEWDNGQLRNQLANAEEQLEHLRKAAVMEANSK